MAVNGQWHSDTNAQLCFRFVVDQLKQIHRRLENKRERKDDWPEEQPCEQIKDLTKKA